MFSLQELMQEFFVFFLRHIIIMTKTLMIDKLDSTSNLQFLVFTKITARLKIKKMKFKNDLKSKIQSHIGFWK